MIPFFSCLPAVRTMIHTSYAIESLNAKMRRSVRLRNDFRSFEAATKLIWLQFAQITIKLEDHATGVSCYKKPGSQRCSTIVSRSIPHERTQSTSVVTFPSMAA
jgi:hypothetical protein